ncbi:aminotransferase class III-fold pyridoxal phosphate-dependent enzyme [Streptosporangium sp. NBC_01755]|uniref:aminotransferase class III-fold pyridoxal phosphate-dependent enzyme n=1 Tax=unclassified Streptosporangium TaxID=2632669 RepID=UPI002DD868FF|nr:MULTISPECIES: aminotransferase class III-fold pyridoxal phosphate-dependent enzyme [unclassified Streptosporangium]WSA29086.1 aminotransferase class III-fold pyridoxal phosphate-dependent enzyme [Streptosporangium sp. NBC_01810]WSC99468.1 aminotransferase class III-fold pyridoxal phosphate-dependent enzyme [Streptosporangium sp. NBC_01755]
MRTQPVDQGEQPLGHGVEAAAAQAECDVAAIIVTPFKHDSFEDQELVAAEFARGVRALADRIGAALVIDDVRGGWRIDLGGSWEPLGVRPDLYAFSKAMANGHPIAAVTGVDALRGPPRRSTPQVPSGSTPLRWPRPRPPSRRCATSTA